MLLDWKKIGIWGAILIGVIGVIVVVASSFNRSASNTTSGTGSPFGIAGSNTSGTGGQGSSGNANLPVFSSTTTNSGGPPIFKIAQGPVVGAVLMQTYNPTTTIARYVTAEDGHVLDQATNVSGASPEIVSNTTIPGVERVIWTEQGAGVIVQYLDSGALKSAHLFLGPISTSTASTTTQIPIAIHFLPDNAVDIAASPDGNSIVYGIPTTAGTDGYVSKPDGSNTKKLFSLPMHQLLLSWPFAGAIVATSKAASGVPGIALSINTKTGAVVPLLYGSGLTALGNTTLSNVLYRTDDGANASLFSENISSGVSSLLSFPSPLSSAIPSQCIWSIASTTSAYCAAPTSALPSGYLDSWYRGQVSAADTLVQVDAALNTVTPLYTPGTRDGGEASDMISLSLSKDEHYLSFIAKDDESVWGVRLSQ